MKIHLPNSAFLGNIDPFIRGFDPASPETLEISANEKWMSVHPAVLSMVAALGLTACLLIVGGAARTGPPAGFVSIAAP